MSVVDTYECSHLSKYKSMNGLKDPWFCVKVHHIVSNVDMIAAATFSMVNAGFEEPCE